MRMHFFGGCWVGRITSSNWNKEQRVLRHGAGVRVKDFDLNWIGELEDFWIEKILSLFTC